MRDEPELVDENYLKLTSPTVDQNLREHPRKLVQY